MTCFQKEITLKPFKRGFHLITDEIIDALKPALASSKNGFIHIFIKHTSASLSINENADPTVRLDFETFFKKLIPEKAGQFLHEYEGLDDMPAHIKSSLLGNSLQIPITNGSLSLTISFHP